MPGPAIQRATTAGHELMKQCDRADYKAYTARAALKHRKHAYMNMFNMLMTKLLYVQNTYSNIPNDP